MQDAYVQRQWKDSEVSTKMTSNSGFNCMRPFFSLCIRTLTFLCILLICAQLLVAGESASASNTKERLGK